MEFEPITLFFMLGILAGITRSDLKIPSSVYDALSIYLLLAIGLKGGVQLAEHATQSMLFDSIVIVGIACVLPLMIFPVLLKLGKFKRADAASIAAHYGSVSVVTFSLAITFLEQLDVPYEGFMIVFLVLLEVPALVIGVLLARYGAGKVKWGSLLHEVFFGKSILLLIGGLLIGYLSGKDGIKPMELVFFDMFKGALAIFLLEMGLVAASRIHELRSHGLFLSIFAIVIPVFNSVLGMLTAYMLGLSLGGALLLATLFASASYIAAPAAMRVAVPEANPALSIGASLGVTFPFNIVLGIPLYYWLVQQLYL